MSVSQTVFFASSFILFEFPCLKVRWSGVAKTLMCRSLQVNSWYIWMFIPQVTISKQGTIGLDPSLSVGCLVMNLGPNSKTDLYCNILQQIQPNLKLAGEIDAGGYMGYWRILIHSAQWGAENTCTPAVQGYFQLVDRQSIGNNSAEGAEPGPSLRDPSRSFLAIL